MEADVMENTDVGVPCYADPLEFDRTDDDAVVVTRRGLVRLAMVAAETGSRFAGADGGADPMAWMLAPRRLFDGRSAMDACTGREDFLRALLLHGLSIGMDADPLEIDGLLGDEPGHSETDGGPEQRSGSIPGLHPEETSHGPEPRLWTSYLVARSDAGMVQAFDAVVAPDRYDVEARLRARYGDALAAGADVAEGFDPSRPLAGALVSAALAHMLEQVADDPGSPLAAGLSVSVQQRFAH